MHSQPDSGCPEDFFPRDKLPREIYACGGGLLVASNKRASVVLYTLGRMHHTTEYFGYIKLCLSYVHYWWITNDTWTCSGRNSFLRSDSCWCTSPGHVSAFFVDDSARVFYWRHLCPRPPDATQTTAAVWVQLSPHHLATRSRRCWSRVSLTTGVQWCPAAYVAVADAAFCQLPVQNPLHSPILDATNLNQTTDWAGESHHHHVR